MRKRRRPKLRLGVLLALLIAMFAPAALGADKDKDKPWYDVPALESKRAWVPWIAAFLFTAGCALIAFKNPHRTHLD
jgi:hypothetical protein